MQTMILVILIITIFIALVEILVLYLHFDKIHENDNYIKSILRSNNYLQLENDTLKRLNTIQQQLLEKREK